MKKLLALVLALVMSMSLVTISNAAFKDADKIDYKEAVDVMNAVGVFIGDEKGNFNAKDNLTREQAAKIIAYLELGEKAADALVGSATFTDVAATRWSAGFVSYCAQAGVVSGNGDGTFAPAGQLTALQFGKMLLVEIGYDAKAAGMVGTDWAINTSKLMATTGLMNGIDGSVNQVLSREKAAQMTLNALKTPTVEYATKGSNITVNGAEINFGASVPTYVTNTVAKEQTISKDTLTNSKEYTIELGEKLYKKLVLSDTTDAFGRPTRTWTFENKKVGEYVKDADLEYTAAVEYKAIYADLALSNAAKIDEYYIDGKEITPAVGHTTISKSDKKEFGANGVLTQVWYDDDNNTVIVTEINTYVGTVNAITKATSSADRFVTVASKDTFVSLNTKFETEDFAIDDLVSFTAAWNASTRLYEIQAVKTLEKSLTGTLTQYTGKTYTSSKWDGQSNFSVDGTKYKYSANAYIDSSNNAMNDFSVGKSDLNVYLDAYGYALYVEGVETEINYAVVIGIGNVNPYGSETNGATLLLPDGTKKEVKYDVDKSRGLTTDNKADEPKGDLVTYTVDSNDVYTLTLADGTKFGNIGSTATTGKYNDSVNFLGKTGSTANFKFENGKSSVVINGTSPAYTTDKTLFFVAMLDGTKVDSYSVYTGFENMPNTDPEEGIKAVAYDTNSKYTSQIDAIYMVVDSLGGISDVDTYLIKVKNASVMTEKINGVVVSYYELPAIVDGEVTTARIQGTTFDAIAKDVNGGVAISNADSEGVYAIKNISKDAKTEIITNASTATGILTGTGTQADRRSVLGIGTTKASASYYAYTKDTTVFYVASDYKSVSASQITSVGTDANDEVYFTIDDNKKTLKEVVIVSRDDSYTPVTSEYSFDTPAVDTEATSKIKMTGTFKRTVNGVTSSYDASNVVVTYTVQTWNDANGQWNNPVTYTSAKISTLPAGSAFAVQQLPVPSGKAVLVSATVTCDVGTWNIAEAVITLA